MTCCRVQVLDDELPADEALVELQLTRADGFDPAVGAGVFVWEAIGDEFARLAPTPPVFEGRHEHDVDLAEGDEDVGFAVDASDRVQRPATSWLYRLVGATAMSWGLSILAHATIIGIAVVVVRFVGVTRPASIDFAYGDGRPEVGLKDRQGSPDRPPGWEGLASALPPGASAATPTPSIERPAETDAVQEESLVEAPQSPSVERPVPPNEARIATESAVDSPLPKFASTLKLPEPLPAITLDPQTPTSWAQPSNSAEPAQVAQAGDGAAGGQGGAATGAGGTAATGDPGIPAGLRDGQKLPTPVYPDLCRRKGEQGEVVLQIEVLPDGSVGEIRVKTDAGFPRLAEAAIRALRGYTFRPALQNGQAVRSILVQPFRFNLG